MPSTNPLRTLSSFILTIVMACAFSAAAQTVDPTFNVVPSTSLDLSTQLQQVVQPDGKIIVFGFKGVADGVAKGDIFRLNADGSLDTSFSYCSCELTNITAIKLTPDGKMIVSGSIPGFGKMIRLNSDGSVDAGFLALIQGPVPMFLGGAEFTVSAVQPDGKVFAMRRFFSSGNDFLNFRRYNTDGTPDDTFADMPLTGGSPASATVLIELVGDGRFIMAYSGGTPSSQSGSITMRSSNGALDGSWDVSSFSGMGGLGGIVNIMEISRESDGSVLAAGRWETVNGLAKKNVVRLLPSGSVDLNFTSPSGQWGHGVQKLADGKILYSVNVAALPFNDPVYKIFRLNSDSSPDGTFAMDPAVIALLNHWVLDPSGRIIAFANRSPVPKLSRFLSNGSLDSSFNPNVTKFGAIYASATRSDGKVVLAGKFSQVNGIGTGNVVIVNSDGSLYSNTFGVFDSPPEQVLIQKDGRILVRGPFTRYRGSSVNGGVVRLQLNGFRDDSLNVGITGTSSIASAMALQTDGRILIGGSFNNANGSARTGIARYAPDGSLDQFNPLISGTAQLRAVTVQDDGMIMIGGLFSGVNGFNRTNMARIAPDGTLDQSFNAGALSTAVAGIWQQPRDGKYVITTGTSTGISRRNFDGTLDTGFNPGQFTSSEGAFLSSVLLQQDGSIIVGGRFDTNMHQFGTFTIHNISRLAANGVPDLTFMPEGTDAWVRTISRYSFSKITVGGDFTLIQTLRRPGAARVTLAPTDGSTLFDFNGDGRADITVFRPSAGVWYELFSGSTVYSAPAFGTAGDIQVAADYDGDGITDEAIFRPSTGEWWYMSSLSNEFAGFPFGQNLDIPRPADYDGDGRADFVIYRPSNNTWYRYSSFTGYAPAVTFGAPGDIPVAGDFDGDGKSDIAVFRPSTGVWWYVASSGTNDFRAIPWGQSGDIPTSADYDGDGKTDVAVFRPSNGVWYVLNSSDLSYISVAFGTNGDRPVAADYDGDGKADIAVFRPTDGNWYLLQSTAGFAAVQWGNASDVAVPYPFP